jgi:hypothetical protein
MKGSIPSGTYKSGGYTDKLMPQTSAVSTAVVRGNHLTLTTVMNGVNVVNRGDYRISGGRLSLAGENYSFNEGSNGFFLDGVWFSKSTRAKVKIWD